MFVTKEKQANAPRTCLLLICWRKSSSFFLSKSIMFFYLFFVVIILQLSFSFLKRENGNFNLCECFCYRLSCLLLYFSFPKFLPKIFYSPNLLLFSLAGNKNTKTCEGAFQRFSRQFVGEFESVSQELLPLLCHLLPPMTCS